MNYGFSEKANAHFRRLHFLGCTGLNSRGVTNSVSVEYSTPDWFYGESHDVSPLVDPLYDDRFRVCSHRVWVFKHSYLGDAASHGVVGLYWGGFISRRV